MSDIGYVIHSTDQPPTYLQSTSLQSPNHWHPKLSPYRLAVLVTTVGFGTAKAIATQNGGAIVSTTLEWVAGTLLSVIFFVLSAYDSREEVPSYLTWLFKPDCMDVVWKFFALFSINRPEYISHETPGESNVYMRSANPDVTPYRILVCSAVTAFGLSKAMLGYANQSTAATWTDWTIAVPVTTALYILGLYEYNSSNIFPGFFNRDQSEILYSVNRGILYSVGIVLASAWVALWTYILYQFTFDPQWKFGSLPEDRSHLTMEAYFEAWQAVSFKIWLQECFFAAIALGVFVLFPLLTPAANSVMAMSVVLRKILRVVRSFILRLVRPILLSIVDDTLRSTRWIHFNWKTIKSYLQILFHVALYMSGVIFMLTFAVVSILAGIVTPFKNSWREPAVFLIVPVWVILGVTLPWVAYNIWKSMIDSMPDV